MAGRPNGSVGGQRPPTENLNDFHNDFPPAGEAGGDDLDGDGRRPADVFVPRWRGGTPAARDFAVTSGLRADLLATSAAEGGGDTAATRYEEQKRSHLNTQRADAQRPA